MGQFEFYKIHTTHTHTLHLSVRIYIGNSSFMFSFYFYFSVVFIIHSHTQIRMWNAKMLNVTKLHYLYQDFSLNLAHL